MGLGQKKSSEHFWTTHTFAFDVVISLARHLDTSSFAMGGIDSPVGLAISLSDSPLLDA